MLSSDEMARLLGEIARASGRPPDAAFIDEVKDRLVGLRMDESLPDYLGDIMNALVTREPLAEKRVPNDDRGLFWGLGELASLVPGGHYEDTGERAVVSFDKTGVRAVVLEPGYAERYLVERFEPVPLAPARGTFEYLHDEASIRRWAADPTAHTVQDADLNVAHSGNLALLAELAGDPAGPRREEITGLLDEVLASAVMGGGDGAAPLLRDALALAQSRPVLDDLSRRVRSMLDFVTGAGPVSYERAADFAHDLLVGVHRWPQALVRVPSPDDWWGLGVEASSGIVAAAYVHAPTGIFIAAAGPIAPDRLRAIAPLASPTAARGQGAALFQKTR